MSPSCAIMTKINVHSPSCFDLVISLFYPNVVMVLEAEGSNAGEMLCWDEYHCFIPSGRVPGSKSLGAFSSFQRTCSVSLSSSPVNSGMCVSVCIKAASPHCPAWFVVKSGSGTTPENCSCDPKPPLSVHWAQW